jgi:8-oxo-dGTP diphosphatase
MATQVDIIKIAGLPIDNGKLLIVKRKGKPIWFSLGGMLEKGETETQCLKREILEELGVKVSGQFKHFCDTPIEPAVGQPGVTIIVKFYVVKLPEGIVPDGEEIEDFKWLSVNDYRELLSDKTIEIGSGLVKYAIPKLINDGLMY